MSPAPPGGFGTMMRIGRGGISSVVAASGSSASASRRETHDFHMSCPSVVALRPCLDVPLALPARGMLFGGGLLQRPFAVAQPRDEALLVQGVELERNLA